MTTAPPRVPPTARELSRMLDRAIVVAHENPGLARDLVATARDLIAGHLHIEEYRLLDAELEASEQVIAEQSREGTA